MLPVYNHVAEPVLATSIPPSTWAILALIVLVPLTAFVLHSVDKKRGDGSVTVFGYSPKEEEDR